jgi:hypothetical protein
MNANEYVLSFFQNSMLAENNSYSRLERLQNRNDLSTLKWYTSCAHLFRPFFSNSVVIFAELTIELFLQRPVVNQQPVSVVNAIHYHLMYDLEIEVDCVVKVLSEVDGLEKLTKRQQGLL